MRRWVQHVLLHGFVKIRHAGLLANRGRTERLALCRALLALLRGVVSALAEAVARNDCSICPACGSVHWGVVECVPLCVASATAETRPAPATSQGPERHKKGQ